MEWPHLQSNATSGAFLEIIEGRSLYFTPQETLIFGYLFDLADTDDDGLVGGSDGGHALLGRARLPPETLQRLWCEAGGGSPDECLARPQWFVLLALVALAQAGRPCTLRDLLNSCDALASQHQQRQHSNKRRTIPNQPQQHQHSSKQALGQPQQQSRRYRQQLPFEQGQGQSRAQVRLGDSNAAVPQSRPIPDFFLEGFPGPLSTASTGGAQPPAERSGRCTELSSGERGSQEASRDSTGVCRNVREDDRRQGRVDGIEDGDGEDDGYQLEVTVYSHRLVGEGYSSHTEYTVLANASLPGFARREMEVSRRFSDFRWLHGCFRAIPGVLPPPLPPSKWAGSSSRDFVAERMKGLQRYMTRVAQHPVLRRQYALQVFLEGTARGLRAAKALLPVRSPGVGGSSPKPLPLTDTLSPSTPSSNPVSPAVSSSPGIFLPDENSARGFVGRRYTLGGADDLYVPGEASVSVPGGGGVHPRKGQRRSMSFGSSDDNSPHGVGGGGGSVVAAAAGGRGGAAYGSSWPLSYVTNLGYETYGNYVSTSMSTSLTSIKGALGAVKVKARSVVGLAAGPAPIAVESEPVYDAEIAHIEELVAPVSGAVKTVESAAVLKRGVGYEMSRLGHYFTQVASLEDMDGVPPGGVAVEGDKSGGLGGGSGARRRSSGGSREATALVDTAFDGLEGLPIGVRGGATFAKAEQVLGQRMERVATAWLEAIDQEESDFLDPLREQLGYLSSAKEVHRDRVRALDALQDANASLQRNKQRLHAARAQGDTHAAVVATSKMDAAEERMAHAHSRAALIAKTFKTEAKRFHGTRRNEGILAVLELAKAQASFARKANAAWKQVLEDINPTDDELRESQQRVQMPKREARIGEGRSSRTSSRTVGVSTVGGWGGVMGDRGGVGHGHGSRRATDNGFAVRESGGGGGSSSGTSAVANGAISPGSMNRGVTKDGRRRPPNRVVAATGSSTSAARREGGGGGRGLVLGLGLKGLGGLGLGSSRSSEAGSRHAGFVGAARGVWGQAEEVDERRQVHQASMTPPRDIRQSSSGSSLFQLNDNDHDDWEALEQPPTPASVAGVDGPLSIAAEAEPEVTVANAHPPPLPSVRSSVSSAYGVEIFDTSTELAAAASTESVYHEEMGMVDRGQRVSTREEAMRGGGDSGARFTSGVEAMQKGGGLETAENASVAPVEAAFAAGAGGGSEDFVTSQLDSLCLDDVPRPLSVPAPPDNADTGLDRVTIGGGSSSGADEEETMTAVARDVGVVEDYVGGGSEESESKGNELPRPPGAASTDKESVSGTAGTVHRTRSKGPKGGGPEGGGVRVRAISGGGVKRGGGGDSKSATDAIGDDDKTSAFDSGSGSGSGGVGTVASPTTVARLAGSPSPPLRRGDGGDGKGDRETNTGEVVDRIVAAGGAGAPTGLRRVTPTGGRGGARG